MFRVDASEITEIVVPAKIARGIARLEQVVEKTLEDVTNGAKSRSRVDTGAMRDGWTNTGAKIERAGSQMMIVGEVYNPVDYTIHNEFGTWKMQAQPMAIPALDEATPGFVAAVEQASGDFL